MRRFYCFTLLFFSIQSLIWSQVQIPFDYQNHIVLKGLVNNEFQARLVLDSGADGLYLDSTFFASTNIPITRSQRATLPGAGSTPQEIVVVLDTISALFGGKEYIPRFVPLISLRPILGQDVDGIIGLNFIRDYVAQLDYRNGLLKLIEPKSFQVPTGWERIPMEIIRNRIHINLEVQINNNVTLTEKFQIDLGNGGTLDFTSPTAEKLKFSENIANKLKYSNVTGGIGGEIKGNQFRANFIKIGKYMVDRPVLDFSEDSSGALASADIGGLLGNQILDRFDLIFDFEGSFLYIKPNGRNETFHSTLTGFSFTNRRDELGGLLITGLFENTLAVKAGLRIGDLITHINGKTIKSLEPRAVERIFKSVQSEVKLTVKRSENIFNVKLLLKDYL